MIAQRSISSVNTAMSSERSISFTLIAYATKIAIRNTGLKADFNSDVTPAVFASSMATCRE